MSKHKQALKNLQTKDPDFYQFLKDQDAELLDFDVSDNEEDGEEEQVSNESDEVESLDEKELVDEVQENLRLKSASDKKGTKKRKLGKTLEEEIVQSSDEEEFSEADFEEDEDEETSSEKVSLTKQLLTTWEEELKGSVISERVIQQLSAAFRAVVEKAGGDVPSSKYELSTDTVFNTVLRLCFSYFPTVWTKHAKVIGPGEKLGKAKWKLLKPLVKDYLFDMVKFIPEINEQQVLAVVLKHLSQIIEYFSPFARKAKTLLKVLIKIWTMKVDECKIVAFVCINKLVKQHTNELLLFTLRKMYLSFAKSTTMVTSRSWPSFCFMQKSYAEICSIDFNTTYQQSFLFIRQLAIYLRNAITSKKKETLKAVFNWPYLLCLYLWSRVLNILREEHSMQPLVYPLTQVIIGCCRLLSTPKYIPFRLHCVNCLLILTENTPVYVPVSALIIEVLESINFDKRQTRQSLKPLELDSSIKLSTSQLEENSYKMATVEQACDLLIETVHRVQGSFGFTELTLLMNTRLKAICKKCRIGDVSQKIRVLVAKIQEHSKWLDEQKMSFYVNLNEPESLKKLEKKLANKSGSPFGKYYELYKKMKERENRIKTEAVKLESVDKETVNVQAAKRKRKPLVEEKTTEKKNPKKKMKISNGMSKKEKQLDDNPDVVTDFSLSDL